MQLHNGCCTSTRSPTSWLSSVPRSPSTSTACLTRHYNHLYFHYHHYQCIFFIFIIFISCCPNRLPKSSTSGPLLEQARWGKLSALRSWDCYRSCEILSSCRSSNCNCEIFWQPRHSSEPTTLTVCWKTTSLLRSTFHPYLLPIPTWTLKEMWRKKNKLIEVN